MLNFLLLPLMSLLVGIGPASAAELHADLPELRAPARSIDDLIGEVFVYNIAFLWFDRLAIGRFSLEPAGPPRTYRAVLEARTMGVAAWLTGNRVQRYVSVMEQGPDGRLRSLSHESHIIRSQGDEVIDRTKRFSFDRERHEVRVEKLAGDRQVYLETLPMTGDLPPEDLLTAFFNFRAGFFGPIEIGRHYLIPTFNRKGPAVIRLDILTGDQSRELGLSPEGGYVCRLLVDPEIFDSSEGSIYVWFDDRLRPVRAVVENVIGLGDVRGSLQR